MSLLMTLRSKKMNKIMHPQGAFFISKYLFIPVRLSFYKCFRHKYANGVSLLF